MSAIETTTTKKQKLNNGVPVPTMSVPNPTPSPAPAPANGVQPQWARECSLPSCPHLSSPRPSFEVVEFVLSSL